MKPKDEAWKAFSRYVRLRDAVITTGSTEYARCCTCGKTYPITELQAGHWITRGRLAVFLDERNVHAQCKGCNLYGRGKPTEYQAYLIKEYGDGVLSELTRQAQLHVKVTAKDWREFTTEYRRRAQYIEQTESIDWGWPDVFRDYVMMYTGGKA